jgi:hypothetical protein
MICPYNIERITQTNQDGYGYDADGYNTRHGHVLIEQRKMMECQKENCAAWQDGKCCFRGCT